MIEITFDESRNLLRFTYIGRVTAEEMRAGLGRLRSMLATVAPGFHALTDLRGLELMEVGSALHVEAAMDLLREKGVEKIARVIPEPTKDIGFMIMSRFHHEPDLQMATFDSLDEAMRYLDL